MGTKITLVTKAVTGRVRYYPVGENAVHVLQLTKKKTLSELDVEALKALGCEIERIKEEDAPKEHVGAPPPKRRWW